MEVRLSEKDVVSARLCEDQNGEWGLYIIPMNAEICITEKEMGDILDQIKEYKAALYWNS